MTLSLAFHDAKAMVSFSLLGLQARSLAFNPLDVHIPQTHHSLCITARQFFTNYSTVFLVLNFEGSGKIFPVPTSWMLFLCFVAFSLLIVPTDFCQCLQILCGFQKFHTFSAGLGLSAFQVRADFAQISNFLRFVFFLCHECSTIAAVSQSYCFIHFLLHRFFTSVSKVPSLPIRVSAVTARSLRASVFFVFFSVLSVCASSSGLSRPASSFSVLAFLLSLSVCCLSPRLSGFPLRFSISHTDLQQFLCACAFL